MGSGASKGVAAGVNASSKEELGDVCANLPIEARAKLVQAMADKSKLILITFTYEYGADPSFKEKQKTFMDKLYKYYETKGELGRLLLHFSFCDFKDGYTAVELFRDAAAMEEHFANTFASPHMEEAMQSMNEGWFKETKVTLYGTDEECALAPNIKDFYGTATRVVGPPPPEKLAMLGNFFGWKKPLVLTFKYKYNEGFKEKQDALLKKINPYCASLGELDTLLLTFPFERTDDGYTAMECFNSGEAFEKHCANVMNSPFIEECMAAFEWTTEVEPCTIYGEADEKAKCPMMKEFYPGAKHVDEPPSLSIVGKQTFTDFSTW